MWMLLFHCHLRKESSLIKGRLLLIDVESYKIVDTYLATSGLPGTQSPADTVLKGRGPIPESIALKIDKYVVNTTPIYMSSTKGVEGNFYKIDPHFVTTQGVTRGDFGIHFDANLPGSAGCIVLTTEVGWSAFQEHMTQCVARNKSQIPLFVSYAKN